jgi:hypothetical protein
MKCLLLVCLLSPFLLIAQSPEVVSMPTIHGVKLFKRGRQESMPLIRLNSNEQLELRFDDLDPSVKDYYYTYVLCDANWQPADLSSFEYIKGFQQERIADYQASSIAQTNYIHYFAYLPNKDCVPSKSGNYLLKVYLNDDTSQLAFTKRLFVVNNKVSVVGSLMQPYDNSLALTHQKLQFTVNTGDLNDPNPSQQLKVVVVQNYKWDEGRYNLQPAFIRNNAIDYDGERDCIFESGKEYRYADLRSSNYLSYSIDKANRDVVPNDIYLKMDGNRVKQQYSFYVDFNGWMILGTQDVPDKWWNSDYANVTFRYSAGGGQPLDGKEIYLVGELTGNHFDENSKMIFNPAKGIYEKTLLLKQGVYSYNYATKEMNNPDASSSLAFTEGNYWETENDYIVLVYYHSYSSRNDELVGVATLNSKTSRSGY